MAKRVSPAALLVALVASAVPWAGAGEVEESKPVPAAEAKAIREVVMAHLEGLRLMRGVRVEVEALEGRHARARAVPPADTTDPAWVFVEKKGSKWVVVLGPGTSFEKQELDEAGVPESLRPRD